MDVISPQLMWINNRCYRINNTVECSNTNEVIQSNEYIEADMYDEDDTDEYDVQLNASNKFTTSFHVPQVFFSQIIGAKGSTLKRLEAETKTQIKVPKQHVDGDIVILGLSRQQVVTCRKRIETIVLAGRKKLQPTHFISIPIRSDTIKANFVKFRDAVLFDKNVFNVESMFQFPAKMHLTICVLSLMDNKDRALAAEILQECKATILDPFIQEYGKLSINVAGVQYFKDEDPSAMNVVFAGVECEPLQQLANQIANLYAFRGLRQHTNDDVILHCTLINTKFANQDNESNNKGKKNFRKTTFDCTNILKKFEHYKFGTETINEIHLSQRFSEGSDGYYEPSDVIKL